MALRDRVEQLARRAVSRGLRALRSVASAVRDRRRPDVSPSTPPPTAVDQPASAQAPSPFDRSDLVASYRWLAREGLTVLNEGPGIREYQPLYGVSEEDRARFPEPRRLVDERWQHIREHLPGSGSAMDVGSQHGWFTFKLAEHGLLALGIEGSSRAYQVAQWLTLYNDTKRTSFWQLTVDAESVRQLPAVDVVVCMAIFHHWVRVQGMEAATSIMQSLADRCRDRMFFETGQVGDTTSFDRSSIEVMGDNPREWIEGFLLGLGFSEVTEIAELSRSTRNDRKRYLMLATR
jgi:hypothetical protein